MKKLQLNAVYATYQGEVNVRGIGAPVIFVRLQGCHLRCYKRTLGTLCDTPEGLEKNPSKETEISEILDKVMYLHEKTKINLICLSGGDPLWNDTTELHKLFQAFSERGFTVSVETSGTLSALPFMHYPNLHWVFDFKLRSAGVTQGFHSDNLKIPNSFIKLVVYDNADLDEAIKVIRALQHEGCPSTVAIGPYWGGDLESFSVITSRIFTEGLGNYVVFNYQLHKLITHADSTCVKDTKIPQLL